MPLIPWNPFRELEDFFGGGPSRFFSGVPTVRYPRMDIYETDSKVVAEVELPGVDPENIDVTVEEDELRIEAKGEQKKKEKKKGYYRRELRKAYYKRRVPLPVEVKGKKTKATYKEGILKVTIPKAKPKKKKKKGIKVKVKTKEA